MKMRCTTVSGGDRDIDVGVWDVTTTTKRVTFVIATRPKGEGTAYLDRGIEKLVCNKDNSSQHQITDWGDGEFTVYPRRNGIPYHFQPL